MRSSLAYTLVALLLPGWLQAQGNPNALHGTGLLGMVGTTVPAQVRCAGGQPTTTFPHCTPETNRTLGRGEEQLWAPVGFSESVAALLDGPITFEVNCTLSAMLRGPCWGKFTWEGGGGVWEGQWVSPVMDLMTYESKISMVGFGTGGAIDGMQLKADGGSAPGDWYITVDVRIK